jgi:hypothetical protein
MNLELKQLLQLYLDTQYKLKKNAKKLLIEDKFSKFKVKSLKLAGSPPIILIKIIIEEPFPRFSLVISSANHIESIDPVVKEKIIFAARTIFQLKTTGFTRIKAIPILKITAQPKVKYLVYRVICCRPNSPSSFCNRSNDGIIGVNNCITIDELI